MPDDLDLVRDVGKVLRDIRLLVTEGIGDEDEIMARKADVLARIEAADTRPCSCGDTGWVEDKNWQGDVPGRSERERWNGLIPCGFCNPDGEHG